MDQYFNEYWFNIENKWKTWSRILWFVIILVAMALSAYYIWEIYHKYEENPFIVNLATRETPIFILPLPAVTICPVVKTVKERFNFTKAVHKIFENTPFDEDEMMRTQYLSLVCENMGFPYRKQLPPNDTFTDEFYDQLNFMEPGSSIFFSCILMGLRVNCTDLFVPIVLDDGICYTFNMLSREEIYKDDVVHYKNYHQFPFKSNWTNDDGYPKEIDIGVYYPRRAFLAGADSALEINLLQPTQDVDYLCSRDVQGYKVVLHTPHTVPQLKKQFITVPPDTFVQAMVYPNMMTTSKEVKHYKPAKRLCYFADERYLKYFKIYSPENCGLECLTNYTLETCGCVDFYMPRNNFTQICGNSKKECIQSALFQMKELELVRQMKVLNAGLDCNCMPLCTELAYHAETSRSFLPWKEQLEAEKRLFEYIFPDNVTEVADVYFSKLSVFFPRDQFITSQRNELYGFFDFLANFGGLLGLFTGFSLLSIVEIVYYLTVRLWCNLANSNDFPR